MLPERNGSGDGLDFAETMISLLYISTSRLELEGADSKVRALVHDSVALNKARDITGALIFTGSHFAQVIEGNDYAVRTLLSSLQRDRRHSNIFVVRQEEITTRRFEGWSMAYSGPSQFVSRRISRLLERPSPAELERSAKWLIDLMCKFATD